MRIAYCVLRIVYNLYTVAAKLSTRKFPNLFGGAPRFSMNANHLIISVAPLMGRMGPSF